MPEQIILVLLSLFWITVGSILGYFTRQSVVKRRAGTLEEKLQKRLAEAKEEADNVIASAKQEAKQLLEKASQEIEDRKKELLKTEQLLLKRGESLDRRVAILENKEQEFLKKVEELKKIKAKTEALNAQAIERLEKLAAMSKEQAKQYLLDMIQKEYEQEIAAKIRRLEAEGLERFSQRAKEIIAFAIQKYAASQSQELSTSVVSLPSEDIKGRIIGKEGRNIRTLEKLTGVEIIIDDSPDTVMVSAFDPVRRHIAKVALEKLIQDGRIQPARIEEIVKKVEEEISSQIKEAGEAAVYDAGIVGLHPRLVQLLGRLKFRTSYGQNVLLHSLEVCHLAGALAAEIGANVSVAKKGGLLHDIGKALDHQVEGSHVDIGIRILEKFGVEKEVIDAMKSHHEDYPYESVEAVIVQAADAISAARPGARKDTIENYLRRLSDLEQIATSFGGVEKAWALQAGREIRVFVRPEEIDDVALYQLAKQIAQRIQEELRYPGEIKVTAIREKRVVEYAR